MAFSWTTPVFDREDETSMMTYTDMNRITQNIGYLQEQLYGSATISKTTWVRNDIIEKSFWESMLGILNQITFDIGNAPRECTNAMHYENINEVERWTQELYVTISGVTEAPLYDANNNALTDHNLEDITVPIYQ